MNETKYPWLSYKVLYTVVVVLLVILVAGSVAWYQQQKQIAQDLNQAVPNTSTQSQGELANWKTYTNTQYGFEVKIPSAWKVLESYDNSNNSDAISFRSQDQSGLNVFVSQISKNTTLTQYLKQADKDSQTAYEGYPSKMVLSSQQVTVGGLLAVKRAEDLQAAGFTTIQTYLIKGLGVYTFELMPNESSVPKYSLDEEKVYNQILSTFKFTK